MNSRNETWVKSMCQKLEDICTDIDEFVSKEPVLFVGNRMETVGANMKIFFSGFVDPSKRVNLVETSTNSVAEIKENTVDSNTNDQKEAPSGQTTSEISQHLIGQRGSLLNKTSDNSTQVNNLDNRFEERVLYDESFHSDATGFDYSDWGIENILDLNLDIDNMMNLEEKSIENIFDLNLDIDNMMNLEEKKTVLNDEFEFDLNTSITHQSSELESSVTCNENQEDNSKHIVAGVLSSENLHESLNSSFKSFTFEPNTIERNPTETVDDFSVSSDVLSSCGSFTTLAYDSNNEADVSCSETRLADGFTVDFEDVKKGAVDSSVINGKLSLFPTTLRSKSYKKMIRDAFMSRKRLTKEYKQLAIWYGDIDKELCQPTKIKSSKQPLQDAPDSEWELL